MKHSLLLLIITFVIAGCASHGTWSKSDRGAWANLGELIGSHELAHYVKQWGEPVSRHEDKFSDGNGNVTTDGEELLWLWKADGTGLSDQSGQGWELLLNFNLSGQLTDWRIGTYRTSLTVADVVAVGRKYQYQMTADLMKELGLSKEQHQIGDRSRNATVTFGPIPLVDNKPSSRERELAMLQYQVRAVLEATFRADTGTRNLYDRLATETEIVDTLKAQAKSVSSANARRQQGQGTSSSTAADYALSSSSLLGRGFLGPYTPNAYGPGMNADATGRPFIWQPNFGGPALGPITPNAYGPGVGMDATGRPVRPACPPGWAGPC